MNSAEEAQKAVKLQTQKAKKTMPKERKEKMMSMYPATASDFLDGLSQYEREQYLLAEKAGLNRLELLGRYGW